MTMISPTQFRHDTAARAQNEGVSNFTYALQLAKRPVEWLLACYGSSRASTILDKISTIATEGILRATNAGIRFESRGTDLNGEIEYALRAKGIGVPLARIAEVRSLEDVSPNADPEITLAPRMQDQTELLTNWKERQDELLAKLLEKLSVFTTLIQMRNRAGIPEDNNLKILALVQQATEGPNQISVWELFTRNYELTFFQTLLAGWFYWAYYMTSLINNTINAYVTAFINNITKKLTTESDQTRQAFFERLIKNAEGFLNKDRIATEKYAYDKEPDLEKVRGVAIQNEYGDLGKLCQDFSVSMIQNDPPTVKFFQAFQDIPIIGHVFSLFEWLVNRFIIQRAMMYSILPGVVQDGVMQGLESIKGNPFAIAMTEFFTLQLEKFKAKLASDQPMDQDATPFPGTEELPKVIKLLLQVLALEGNYTARELRQKIEQNAKNGDSLVVTKIQEGIITGVNALFLFLNESMQSGELVTTLLELSLLPFEGGEKDQVALTAAYEAECAKFKKTARKTLQLLIQKAIAGPGNTDQQKILSATQSRDAQRAVLDVLVPKLGEICGRMENQIAASQNGSTETSNIHADIIDLLQILQVLSSRKELQDELEKLDGTHRNELWRRFVPLHKRAQKMAEELLELQEHQNSHLRLTSAVTHLTQAKAFLNLMGGGLSGQSRHLQNPLIPLLDQAAIELSKALEKDAPVPLKFKEKVQRLDSLSQAVSQEQNVIDAISILFPQRASSRQGNGLLDQLLRFRRGERIPEFSPKDCMAKIAKNLEFFPKDEESQAEKRELEALIGDGTHLEDRWDQLSLTLQSIYVRHSHLKNQHQTLLTDALTEASNWIDQKIAVYQSLKDQDYQKMQRVMARVSKEGAALQRGSNHLGAPLSRPLSNWIWTVIPFGLGAYVGWPGIGASIAGGLFNKWWHNPTDTAEEFGWPTFGKKLLQTLVPLAIKGYTAWDPSIILDGTMNQGLNALIGASAGYSAYSTYRSGKETVAFNQVWEIFEKAYDFSLDQRVYWAAATRLINELTRNQAGAST